MSRLIRLATTLCWSFLCGFLCTVCTAGLLNLLQKPQPNPTIKQTILAWILGHKSKLWFQVNVRDCAPDLFSASWPSLLAKLHLPGPWLLPFRFWDFFFCDHWILDCGHCNHWFSCVLLFVLTHFQSFSMQLHHHFQFSMCRVFLWVKQSSPVNGQSSFPLQLRCPKLQVSRGLIHWGGVPGKPPGLSLTSCSWNVPSLFNKPLNFLFALQSLARE